jgi:hypothetical protein
MVIQVIGWFSSTPAGRLGASTTTVPGHARQSSDLLYAMDHRRDEAYAICWSTWASLLCWCPLATAADWGYVPGCAPLV